MPGRRRPTVKQEPAICPTCQGGPRDLIYVRERLPGSKGRMAQSFGGAYRICSDCIAHAQKVGGICGDEPAVARYERRVTVLAGTYAWLKAIYV